MFYWSPRPEYARATGLTPHLNEEALPIEPPEEQSTGFIKAAASRGVQRFVMLSAWGPESVAETSLRESGMQWTSVSPSWFNQNVSDDYEQKFREDIRAGEMVTSYGASTFAFIDADDIADVVVAALLEDGHHGQSYRLTGPRSLSFAQAAQEIAQALGRPISYTELTPEQYAQRLISVGLPSELAAGISDMGPEEWREEPTGDVQRALGRAPKDFADYARETAATGAWNA
ncbi:NmrA family NAD(P)-binding protein (plasmid) [Streptomyces sp. NBC_01591]|uniref:NmrA family NAD(P)-binding protein n=1 Tax=Streptomyces sp. NBC_01591 TaxID=2975888 RepID=UPI002DDBA849|nr:NmrA family NAD(P)-binding protein [Streptomyces sp. NBC_01591]WSD74745.1 NmrA family NAD(P)-binding protein [Streptomyces sp. NBC_01591]